MMTACFYFPVKSYVPGHLAYKRYLTDVGGVEMPHGVKGGASPRVRELLSVPYFSLPVIASPVL